MRNEQAASYAANAWGYLTGQPGVCLVVSGPGFLHALAGLANAQANGWSMLLIAGSSDQDQESMGAFQEMPQVECARLYTKYAARPSSLAKVPFFLEKAMRTSLAGRRGPVYIDLPGNFITEQIEDDENASESGRGKIKYYGPLRQPSKCMADPADIEKAVQLMLNARKPLIIIGKGCNSSFGSEKKILELVELMGFPFLPTPMGKGVISDLHTQSIAPARSHALGNADLIILFGARLNWMLHFGQEPRFASHVKIIQIDICPEEMGNNVPDKVFCGLLGDVDLVARQLLDRLKANTPTGADIARDRSKWWQSLKSGINSNRQKTQSLMDTDQLPMNYYRAFKEIKNQLPRDFILVSEGANTMDIGRSILDQLKPRTRIDAGSFGTMGVGLGFSIAAQLAHPNQRVVCIQGDSAFGFSCPEIETVCRLQLPILIIVINNNGIYGGIERSQWEEAVNGRNGLVPDLPSTSLLPNANYEQIMQAFGGIGKLVKTPEQLSGSVKDAIVNNPGKPYLINCLIEPTAARKQQEHNWLTRKSNL